MARPLSKEMKALHKKFIPGNIIICLIALVAGICMILMPWIDIRIHVEGAKLAEILTTTETSNNSGNAPYAAYESNEDNAGDTYLKAFAEALKDFNYDIPINIRPSKMISAATGGKTEIEEMFSSAIGKDGAEQLTRDFVNELAPVVVKASLTMTIEQMFAELEDEFGDDEEVAQYIEEYKGLVVQALDNIQANPSAENAKKELNFIADTIVADQDGITEEDVKIIRKIVDEVVRQATNESGDFDYYYLIKNLDIDGLADIIESEISKAPENVPTKANVGFAVTFEGEETNPETPVVPAQSDSPLTAVMDILENPGALVVENLDEQTVKTINTIFLVMTLVFIGVPVLLCFVLALASGIRIFTENKRVRFWYVSLILFASGFTVLMLNLLTHFILPTLISTLNLGSQVGAIFEAFSISFLGSGIANGICWLVLTMVSLFYYRRVKKKIKIQKQIERNNLNVSAV